MQSRSRRQFNAFGDAVAPSSPTVGAKVAHRPAGSNWTLVQWSDYADFAY